jgi:hypothetical protein
MHPLSVASRNGDSGGIRFERLLHCETSGSRLECHPTDPLTRTIRRVDHPSWRLGIASAALSRSIRDGGRHGKRN